MKQFNQNRIIGQKVPGRVVVVRKDRRDTYTLYTHTAVGMTKNSSVYPCKQPSVNNMLELCRGLHWRKLDEGENAFFYFIFLQLHGNL